MFVWAYVCSHSLNVCVCVRVVLCMGRGNRVYMCVCTYMCMHVCLELYMPMLSVAIGNT